jgi:hypothetical protein
MGVSFKRMFKTNSPSGFQLDRYAQLQTTKFGLWRILKKLKSTFSGPRSKKSEVRWLLRRGTSKGKVQSFFHSNWFPNTITSSRHNAIGNFVKVTQRIPVNCVD